jgi:hypothetical protein
MYLKIQLAFLLTLLCITMQAQKKKERGEANSDTLAIYRQFVQVSNIYQQLPLYLQVELVNATNFITGEQDTARLQATFFMKPGISYIRFGESEQLINDSMAVIVSDKLQRMIVYSNAQPVLKQLQSVSGMQWQGSSPGQIASRFTAQLSKEKQLAVITLTGRSQLYGTAIPKESVELQYDAATKQPVQVITTKRTLVPLSEDDYKTLSENAVFTGKLLKLDEQRYCLIKEQTGTFVFKKIDHDAGIAIPVTIADRIVRDDQGEFKPVKAYEAYAISIN